MADGGASAGRPQRPFAHWIDTLETKMAKKIAGKKNAPVGKGENIDVDAAVAGDYPFRYVPEPF